MKLYHTFKQHLVWLYICTVSIFINKLKKSSFVTSILIYLIENGYEKTAINVVNNYDIDVNYWNKNFVIERCLKKKMYNLFEAILDNKHDILEAELLLKTPDLPPSFESYQYLDIDSYLIIENKLRLFKKVINRVGWDVSRVINSCMVLADLYDRKDFIPYIIGHQSFKIGYTEHLVNNKRFVINCILMNLGDTELKDNHDTFVAECVINLMMKHNNGSLVGFEYMYEKCVNSESVYNKFKSDILTKLLWSNQIDKMKEYIDKGFTLSANDNNFFGEYFYLTSELLNKDYYVDGSKILLNSEAFELTKGLLRYAKEDLKTFGKIMDLYCPGKGELIAQKYIDFDGKMNIIKGYIDGEPDECIDYLSNFTF